MNAAAKTAVSMTVTVEAETSFDAGDTVVSIINSLGLETVGDFDVNRGGISGYSVEFCVEAAGYSVEEIEEFFTAVVMGDGCAVRGYGEAFAC